MVRNLKRFFQSSQSRRRFYSFEIKQDAFYNYYTSFLTKTDSLKIILKLLDKKGVFNIGGIKQSAYNYAKKLNPNIKMGEMKKNMINLIGKDTSVSIKKLKKVIKK